MNNKTKARIFFVTGGALFGIFVGLSDVRWMWALDRAVLTMLGIGAIMCISWGVHIWGSLFHEERDAGGTS